MTEIILSVRGKKQMLKNIEKALGQDKSYKSQFKKFLTGKMSTEVSYRNVNWTIIDTPVEWLKKFIPCPLLSDGWFKDKGNGYLHYGKKDSKEFEVHSANGTLYMKDNNMILATYPDIGKTVKSYDTLRLDKVELDEKEIHIIMGPAIWGY